MATHRVIHEDSPPPTPVTPDICDCFPAQLGAQVTFQNVSGIQTITAIPGQIWPFTIASPMTVPNPATINILTVGLTVGQTYYYNVSQVCPQHIQKGVTITN